ncbi:hypothetical protein N779_21790 [Vibrio coralliilyticus OCN008]|nr:hypothetical protein N779_21790 [Vibrio coralliilyticus OCN008]
MSMGVKTALTVLFTERAQRLQAVQPLDSPIESSNVRF